MWNVNTKAIPITITATGTISKSFKIHPTNMLRKHEIKDLEKIAILGTAHILQKILNQKYRTLNMVNNKHMYHKL
jgi:hypothetical protein